MKISFLIPSKNRLELLKRCLHSIREQKNVGDLEIIISDNASTEDYQCYIDGLSDPRIVYLRQPKSLPVTENWQAALSRATGDYILMLGDDDALAPEFFPTVTPFMAADGPDLLYLGVYHYCYPSVMPGSMDGFFAEFGCEFLPNDNGAFCLLPHYARDLSTSVLEFRYRYGFNAQHFLIRKSFIDRIADLRTFYQSPYPDYYVAAVAFAFAESIVVIPRPSVIIGISPKSFGAYYFSSRQEEGYEFLDNDGVDAGLLSVLQDRILPGDGHNTKWLIAAEYVRRAYSASFPQGLNFDRYTAAQIAAILRRRFLEKKSDDAAVAAVRNKLSGQTLLLFEACNAALEAMVAADLTMLTEFFSAFERKIGQYPSFYGPTIDIGIHQSIVDAFDWLASTPEAKEAKLKAKEAALWAKEIAAREEARRANVISRRLRRRARALAAKLFATSSV